ncbi:BatA domain-containing protein, partial [Akkermansiaceae bacterium]|nr:BatA domain-containing protein [Akkermansiaceae bacterium]
MPFFFANIWGLLALLAIPAILAIHFLQRRSKEVPCSTLFLLQKAQKESAAGRKFDKFIPSMPLWMQLLMVLLVAFLLAQPRFVNKQATQRVAVVLDSSASMSVFTEKLQGRVLEAIPKVQGIAPNIELWVMDSDLSKERLYYGNSLDELAEKLKNWAPESGSATPQPALRLARSLIGKDGALLYFTDTPQETSTYNASVYAIGEARQNVGFTGVSFKDQR